MTIRKHLITEMLENRFQGQAVLLDELRWHVLVKESTQQSKALHTMSRSYMVSFVRTIRRASKSAFVR